MTFLRFRHVNAECFALLCRPDRRSDLTSLLQFFESLRFCSASTLQGLLDSMQMSLVSESTFGCKLQVLSSASRCQIFFLFSGGSAARTAVLAIHDDRKIKKNALLFLNYVVST